MKWIAVLFVIVMMGHSSAYAASVCRKKVCIEVEVMRTDEELRRGLQGKESLALNQGMFFVFEKEALHRFWMKDMTFAIDMIWLNAKGKVVTIASACPPCLAEPCAVYAPSKEARYVLEVSSGFALKHHWKEGDVFQFKGIH